MQPSIFSSFLRILGTRKIYALRSLLFCDTHNKAVSQLFQICEDTSWNCCDPTKTMLSESSLPRVFCWSIWKCPGSVDVSICHSQFCPIPVAISLRKGVRLAFSLLRQLLYLEASFHSTQHLPLTYCKLVSFLLWRQLLPSKLFCNHLWPSKLIL